MNILNKLTIKHLKMNKKRTIVTIIGIILSTALMVGIGTFASSFREFLIEDTINHSGSQHVIIGDVKYNDYKYIKDNINVDKSKLKWTNALGYAKIDSSNEYKPYLYVINVNQKYLKDVELVDGTLPKNNYELLISEHTNTNGMSSIKVGDVINLDISNRIIINNNQEEVLTQNNPFIEGETLKLIDKCEYKVVGIIKRLNDENYSSPGYTAITVNKQLTSDSKLDVFIEYKNIKNITEKTDKILKNLKISDDKVSYNDTLLAFYGQSSYDNFNAFIAEIIAVVLLLLTIACASVIYNSFAISVMERKKQFGLFSSIGATSKQLKKTVFFEALIVSAIGIPLGIISGIGGVAITILVINSLLSEMLEISFVITLYPLFIILPIVYMIITIIISAYLPAKRAAKINPIDAIRLNDDIKLNKKSVKSNKLINKLFGIEGSIAYKNIKRNKKKYRITIISLFVSIVLFISFSTFLTIGNKATKDIFMYDNMDIYVDLWESKLEEDSKIDEYTKKISKVSSIDKLIIIQYTTIFADINKNNLTKEGIDYYKFINFYPEVISSNNNKIPILIYAIDDKLYQEYLNKIHVKEDKIIIFNSFKYQNENHKTFVVKPLKNMDNNKLYAYEENPRKSDDTNKYPNDGINLDYELYLANEEPKYLKDLDISRRFPSAIVSNTMIKDIIKKANINVYTGFGIQAKDFNKCEKDIKKAIDYKENANNKMSINNVAKMKKFQNNFVLVISILLYGFITLVTLIGVTSVFNTINTSMALRRKEFAVLRSIGLSPLQFNKMILFESFFYGIKALFYALPVSFGFIVLFNYIFNSIASYDLIVPYTAIVISVIGVFVLTLTTMMYAVKKQKHENILDVIREENI
ncbi:MAG: FtsX-like permease family protein [Bacilli bacterium]